MKGFIYAGLALIAGIAPADAAQPYPSRPVRIIVAYAPGGGSDQLARLVAPRLTQEFGQQFIIDNRPGGNTLIAMQLLADAPADGHTLGVVDTAFAINPALMAKLPYDSARAFSPVALLATSPFVLVVHPSLAAKNVAELVALAKAKPGQITFSSAGPGTGTRIASDQHPAGAVQGRQPFRGRADCWRSQFLVRHAATDVCADQGRALARARSNRHAPLHAAAGCANTDRGRLPRGHRKRLLGGSGTGRRGAGNPDPPQPVDDTLPDNPRNARGAGAAALRRRPVRHVGRRVRRIPAGGTGTLEQGGA